MMEHDELCPYNPDDWQGNNPNCAERLAALERVRVMDAAVECRCDRLPADWDALRTDPLGHHPRCPSSSSAATTGDTDD